jgi:hypothetical protein
MSRTFSMNNGSFESFKGLGAMRLQRKGLPDAGDRRLRHAAVFRKGPRAPMRRVPWRRLQRRDQDEFHVGIGDPARRSRPRLIQQAIKTQGDEVMAPAGYGRFGHLQLASDGAD